MRTVMVRYKLRPGQTAENERLMKRVHELTVALLRANTELGLAMSLDELLGQRMRRREEKREGSTNSENIWKSIKYVRSER